MPFDEGRRGGHAGENLLWLRDALRAEMPLGFAWDFSHIYVRPVNRCGSAGCALGLAMQRWPEALVPSQFKPSGDRRYPAHVTAVTGLGVHEQWARFFGMPTDIFVAIFLAQAKFYGVATRLDVTPAMVASAIDHYDVHGTMDGFVPQREVAHAI